MWMAWLSHKIFPFLFSLHTAENKNTFQENKDDGIEEGGQLPASTINPIPHLYSLWDHAIPKKIHLSLFFLSKTFICKLLLQRHCLTVTRKTVTVKSHTFSLWELQWLKCCWNMNFAQNQCNYNECHALMVIINWYILMLHIAPSFHYLHINVAHSTTSTHLLAGS